MQATKSVEHKEGKAVYRAQVQRLTYGGKMSRDSISVKLSNALKERNGIKPEELNAEADVYHVYLSGAAWRYANAVAQTRAHEGFELPLPTDSAERLLEAYDNAINDLPIEFVTAWFEASESVQGSLLPEPVASEGEENPT